MEIEFEILKDLSSKQEFGGVKNRMHNKKHGFGRYRRALKKTVIYFGQYMIKTKTPLFPGDSLYQKETTAVYIVVSCLNLDGFFECYIRSVECQKHTKPDISSGKFLVARRQTQKEVVNLQYLIDNSSLMFSGQSKFVFFPYWIEISNRELLLWKLDNLPEGLKKAISDHRRGKGNIVIGSYPKNARDQIKNAFEKMAIDFLVDNGYEVNKNNNSIL